MKQSGINFSLIKVMKYWVEGNLKVIAYKVHACEISQVIHLERICSNLSKTVILAI
jgi:hypothetical protein